MSTTQTEPTEFISAAMRGDVVATSDLITKGFDVNQIDDKGNSALHWAAYFDEIEVIKLLLTESKIKINLQSLR